MPPLTCFALEIAKVELKVLQRKQSNIGSIPILARIPLFKIQMICLDLPFSPCEKKHSITFVFVYKTVENKDKQTKTQISRTIDSFLLFFKNEACSEHKGS